MRAFCIVSLIAMITIVGCSNGSSSSASDTKGGGYGTNPMID